MKLVSKGEWVIEANYDVSLNIRFNTAGRQLLGPTSRPGSRPCEGE